MPWSAESFEESNEHAPITSYITRSITNILVITVGVLRTSRSANRAQLVKESSHGYSPASNVASMLWEEMLGRLPTNE
jgi:hypothetical protein